MFNTFTAASLPGCAAYFGKNRKTFCLFVKHLDADGNFL